MMGLAAVGLFLGHSLLMLLDEFHFHYRRGLPRWERWGHPLDTLSVLACYLFALSMPFSIGAAWGYAALAVGSCLLVTKDEGVHAERCGKGEQWLHSVLFVLHPLLLAFAGWYWLVTQGPAVESAFARVGLPGVFELGLFRMFLPVHAGLTALFLIYQIIWWNWIWKEKPSSLPKRRMPLPSRRTEAAVR